MKLPTSPIRLIVGLGNPGPEYENTRHNAGQDWVERLADSHAKPLLSAAKFFGLSTVVSIQRQEVRLLIPTTFMNRSGQSVAALSHFYKIPAESILVVHDELDLTPGVARLKFGGGHGGHNGLRDIISSLGNQKQFARLRIGIGHPGAANAVANYVLKRASSADRQRIDTAIDESLSSLDDLILGDWDKACRCLHGKQQNASQ